MSLPSMRCFLTLIPEASSSSGSFLHLGWALIHVAAPINGVRVRESLRLPSHRTSLPADLLRIMMMIVYCRMVRVVIEARIVEVRGAQADPITHSDVTCTFTPTSITISKGMVWYSIVWHRVSILIDLSIND